MNERLLYQYAEAAINEARWKAVKDELKPNVLAHLHELKLDSLTTQPGTFSVVHGVKYEFTPELEELELKTKAKLEKAKEKEIAKGLAIELPTEALRFQARKEA